jgi:glycosyltransferase 2 family protein
VNGWYVAAALGLYLIGVLTCATRWRTILASLGTRVRMVDTALAHLAGIFAGNVTPASRVGGEACRIAAIGLRSRVALPVAAMASVYDRLSEVPPVVVLVVAAVPTLAVAGARVRIGRVAVTALAAALALLVFGSVRVVRRHASWRSWRERIASGPVGRETMAAAVGFSSVVWLQDVVRLMIVAAAFGVPLTVSQGATLSVLTIVGGMLPTMGGLGAIEGGLVAGLVLFGIRIETAAAITAAERAISYGLATVAGGSAFALIGGRQLWQATRSGVRS